MIFTFLEEEVDIIARNRTKEFLGNPYTKSNYLTLLRT